MPELLLVRDERLAELLVVAREDYSLEATVRTIGGFCASGPAGCSLAVPQAATLRNMTLGAVQAEPGSIEPEPSSVRVPAWSESESDTGALATAGHSTDETAKAAAQRLVQERVPLTNADAADFRGRVQVASDHGRAAQVGSARLVRGQTREGARSGYLLAVLGPLILLLLIDPDRPELTWALVPADGDVTERADALRLLRALSGRGTLEVEDQSAGDFSTPSGGLEIPGFEWTLEQEWRLFEDLATLIEWSGVDIPQPQEVNAEQATQLAQAAEWVRTERIEARLTGPLSFRGDPDKVEGADGLRMEESFGVHLLGQDIPLGTGVVRVSLRDVEIGPRGPDALAATRAWATGDKVVFSLDPPAGRRTPPQRTQSRPEPPRAVTDDARAVLDELGATRAQRDMSSALEGLARQCPGNESATARLQRLREDRLA